MGSDHKIGQYSNTIIIDAVHFNSQLPLISKADCPHERVQAVAQDTCACKERVQKVKSFRPCSGIQKSALSACGMGNRFLPNRCFSAQTISGSGFGTLRQRLAMQSGSLRVSRSSTSADNLERSMTCSFSAEPIQKAVVEPKPS